MRRHVAAKCIETQFKRASAFGIGSDDCANDDGQLVHVLRLRHDVINGPRTIYPF